MVLVLIAIGVLFGSGLCAWLFRRRPNAAAICGVTGAVLASGAGLFGALDSLLCGADESVRWVWSAPWYKEAELSFGMDGLSAFFLLPIFFVTALAAVYGVGYLRESHDSSRRTRNGASWLFFNGLTAGMALVCVARNILVFLTAWELMALTSFFLVAFDRENPHKRKAAWLYLAASHLGTAFLLPMFFLMTGYGDGDFASFGIGLDQTVKNVCFLLAVIGFGTKAGFIPLHIWLPEAHPAAPTHVSAVMSGVMIKTGIYGLMRMFGYLGDPPLWWGVLLIGIGAASGVLGILFALAQHDLKRLLAYSSVENIGVIALGMGVGLVGWSEHLPGVAVLGFAGALLHVLNHALFKSLLFFGAGAIQHAAGTLELDRLGGLLKKMPWAGGVFFIGAVAICGLPPLNGFVGEFCVFWGSLQGLPHTNGFVAGGLLIVILALGFIGGLAAACFTKAFGIVFLGEPRGAEAADAHESGRRMLWPMLLAAAACIALGLSGLHAFRAVLPAVIPSDMVVSCDRPRIEEALAGVGLGAATLWLLILFIALFRKRILAGRQTSSTVTWDCGYVAPSSRMQYTASSFAQPLTDMFAFVLRTSKHIKKIETFFPKDSQMETETPDVFREKLYLRAFSALRERLAQMRLMQHGRVHLYVLYVVLTLVALLIWKMG